MNVRTLAILCNNWCLFCLLYLTPDFLGLLLHSFHLAFPCPNKIDSFKIYDGDRETEWLGLSLWYKSTQSLTEYCICVCLKKCGVFKYTNSTFSFILNQIYFICFQDEYHILVSISSTRAFFVRKPFLAAFSSYSSVEKAAKMMFVQKCVGLTLMKLTPAVEIFFCK